MFRSRVWTGALIASPAPMILALVDPVGGRVASWPNALFVVTVVLFTVAAVSAFTWWAERPGRCFTCGTRCRRPVPYGEVGGWRVVCPRCAEPRAANGGPY